MHTRNPLCRVWSLGKRLLGTGGIQHTPVWWGRAALGVSWLGKTGTGKRERASCTAPMHGPEGLASAKHCTVLAIQLHHKTRTTTDHLCACRDDETSNLPPTRTRLVSKQHDQEVTNSSWDKERVTFLTHNGASEKNSSVHQVCRAQRNIIYHYKASWPTDLTNLLLFPYSLAKQEHVKTIFLLLSHLLAGSRSTYTSNKSYPTEQKKAVSLKSIFMTRSEALKRKLFTLYWFYTHTEHSTPP